VYELGTLSLTRPLQRGVRRQRAAAGLPGYPAHAGQLTSVRKHDGTIDNIDDIVDRLRSSPDFISLFRRNRNEDIAVRWSERMRSSELVDRYYMRSINELN
jgi:hypothetical protein